jgi:hypothetical protein
MGRCDEYSVRAALISDIAHSSSVDWHHRARAMDNEIKSQAEAGARSPFFAASIQGPPSMRGGCDLCAAIDCVGLVLDVDCWPLFYRQPS